MAPIGIPDELARAWEEKQQRMQANSRTGEDDPVTLYDADRGRAICDRVAAGEALRAICGAGADLQRTMRWLFFDEVPDFTARYLAARSARLELMLDEVVSIADDLAWPEPSPPPPARNGDGQQAESGNAANAEKPETAPPPAAADKDRLAIAKLRIEARRWLIERQLKTTSGADTSASGQFVASEILRDGVSS